MRKIEDNFWFVLILFIYGIILQALHPHWLKEVDYVCIFYHIVVIVLVVRYVWKRSTG